MCGRFNLRSSLTVICQQFLPGVENLDTSPFSNMVPRYNVAPTQQILAVTGSEVTSRQFAEFRWGLIPDWAKDMGIGSRMINARSETVAEKPSFRSAFKSRRCIIPADGYYEWEKTAGGKQPYEFFDPSGRLLPLAGLWEFNSKIDPNGDGLLTCTILTIGANDFASQTHDRMPVILNDSDFDLWLDPTHNDVSALRTIMNPAEEDRLSRRPVSKLVNDVRNEGIGDGMFEQ